MPQYVDGYVIPIPKDKIAIYRKVASKAGKIWKEHGALAYRECVGEDLDVKELLPFPKIAKAKPGETVVFSYVVFKSRKHRDTVNAKCMKDPRMDKMAKDLVDFMDCKRMAFGGFQTIVNY